MRVLFVCHANTSRSIMAEEILRRLAGAAGRDDIRVDSVGVAPFARSGALVSLDSLHALQDIGIDIPREKSSRALRDHPDLLSEADLVVAMTDEQREILAGWPSAEGVVVHTLRELAGEEGDIEDPARRDEAFFTATCQEIERLIRVAFDEGRGPAFRHAGTLLV